MHKQTKPATNAATRDVLHNERDAPTLCLHERGECYYQGAVGGAASGRSSPTGKVRGCEGGRPRAGGAGEEDTWVHDLVITISLIPLCVTCPIGRPTPGVFHKNTLDCVRAVAGVRIYS